MTDTTADAKSIPVLGQLKEIEPRTVWANEARDFTPWLLSNAEELGAALGIELELHQAEHPVGGFSLDLIGRDLSNGVVLIVENQIERSDHDHLGKLVTYAAGTGASTIVWITREFREEHRQALDWLNEHTVEEIHFFGVEVRLIQIDNSLPSAQFVLEAKPNGWQKAVRAAASGQLAGRALAYQEFWTRYLDRLRTDRLAWTKTTTPPMGNELWMAAGTKGCGFKCAFNGSGMLRHELYIDFPTGDESHEFFAKLQASQEKVEASYGRSLQWDGDPARYACRVIDTMAGDVLETDRHDEFIDFLVDAGIRFRKTLNEVSAIA